MSLTTGAGASKPEQFTPSFPFVCIQRRFILWILIARLHLGPVPRFLQLLSCELVDERFSHFTFHAVRTDLVLVHSIGACQSEEAVRACKGRKSVVSVQARAWRL